ncbi:MAG: T9SS type A sorting domain-containing protein [Cryomorphaceae bacterium]
MNGRLVLQEKNVNEINLEGLETGTYFLQALIGGVVSSQLVIKQ